MLIRTVATLALLSLLQGGSSDADGFVLRNLIHFDRVYIPALVYTEQGNLPESRRAIGTLRREWNDFRRRNHGWVRNDPESVEGFGSIDGKILKAEETIAYGRSLSEAHAALEGIRDALLTIRRRLGMEYFPDLLIDFHGPMEKIVQTVEGKKPGGLSPEDLTEIRTSLETAGSIWKRVAETKLDADLYQFDEQAVAAFKKGVDGVEASLESLSQALAKADQAQIIQLAGSLQPGFARVYLLFGGFTG